MRPWSQPLLWPHPSGAVACDPYFGNVVLLDGFNGTNGSTTSVDESPAAHGAATFTGSNVLSTAQVKFGTASLLSSNTAGAGTTWPASSDFDLSTIPFTIECWFYGNTIGGNQFLISTWGGGHNEWILWINVITLGFRISTNGVNAIDVVLAGTVTAAVWHHAAVDFDGTKYRLYLDGVMTGSSTTLQTIFVSTSNIGIGNDAYGGGFILNGYIDEVRITKGVARYASDGVVSTWNPSDAGANISLSGGNLIVSATSSTASSVRNTNSHSTGKYYFESTFANMPTSGSWGAGLANATYALTGTSANAAVLFMSTGNSPFIINSITQFNLGASVSGDVVCVAVDIGAALIWVRRNSGNWNNSGTANPATG